MNTYEQVLASPTPLSAELSRAANEQRLLYIFPEVSYFLGHWIERVHLAKCRGYEVHVAIPQQELPEGVDLSGIHLHRIPLVRGRCRPLDDVRTLIALRRLFDQISPELVHAVTIKPIILGGFLARLADIRHSVYSVTGLGYAFTSRSLLGRCLGAIARWGYWFAFGADGVRVIFENPDDRSYIERLGIADGSKTRMFLGGGIDLNEYAYSEETETGSPLVILASRMLRDKGVCEFVEAARQLKRRGVPARLVLVGDVDPANPASLKRADLDRWRKEGVVEWWGWRDDMPEVMRQANVVCLPSYYGEGAPRTLIEAAATGRACVAADVPGSRHVLDDGVTGLLVPPRDSASLAVALEQLVTDEPRRRLMGVEARRRAEDIFSTEKAASRMLSVYSDLFCAAPV